MPKLTNKIEWFRRQRRYMIIFDAYCNWGAGAFCIVDRMTRTMLDDGFPTQQRAIEFLWEGRDDA